MTTIKNRVTLPDGVNSLVRLLIEFLVAFIFIFYLNKIINPNIVNIVFIPFTKGLYVDLGFFYYLFASFVIVGCANLLI